MLPRYCSDDSELDHEYDLRSSNLRDNENIIGRIIRKLTDVAGVETGLVSVQEVVRRDKLNRVESGSCRLLH